jgi:protein-disulfide isomerase
MAKQETKKSGTPVMIIVLVLVLVVIVGAVYWSGSRKTTPRTNTNSPTNVATGPTIPPGAPAGAQPPNALGAENASVTVEEFADFQCPSCGVVHPMMQKLESMFVPRVRFIFRNFPLPMHDKAYDASLAAEAAGLQGPEKFWAMHNLLYTNQKLWSNDPNYKQVFKDYASKIGLDADRFENDMIGLQTKNRVDQDIIRGRALSINSTPTIYVNGRAVPSDSIRLDAIQQIIEEQLKAAQQPAQSAPPANGGK